MRTCTHAYLLFFYSDQIIGCIILYICTVHVVMNYIAVFMTTNDSGTIFIEYICSTCTYTPVDLMR